MKKIYQLLFGLLLLSNIAFSNDKESQELIILKCASCHVLNIPNATELANLSSPPMNAVMFHVKEDFKNELKQEEFISKYALNPQPKTAVCKSDKVDKFGLMPSMKGKVTEEELRKISHYLVQHFPTKEFVKTMRINKLYQEIATLRHSSFLINQKRLPKLTKLLMENWGKGKLSLSPTQKAKLLIIRKNIIETIMDIKEKVTNLEDEIIEMSVDGDDIENIEVKVNEVAKLKAKVTITQIKCLKDSVEILTDKQLYTLLPMWGM